MAGEDDKALDEALEWAKHDPRQMTVDECIAEAESECGDRPLVSVVVSGEPVATRALSARELAKRNVAARQHDEGEQQ